MSEVRTGYGALTKEFLDDVAPHERMIRSAIRDLIEKGYSEPEIYASLVDAISMEFSTRRLKRGLAMRMEEREARKEAKN
jgi:hypothetical protein